MRLITAIALYIPYYAALLAIGNMLDLEPGPQWMPFSIGGMWLVWYIAGTIFPPDPNAPKRQPRQRRPRGYRHPGHVYLIELPGLTTTKLGITKNLRSRVGEHTANGWTFVDAWTFQSIEEARAVESAVHYRADQLGARPKDPRMKAVMPQGGYTEVMHLTSEQVREIVSGLITIV